MNVVYHLLNIPELLVSVTQFGLAQPVKFPEKTEQPGRAFEPK